MYSKKAVARLQYIIVYGTLTKGKVRLVVHDQAKSINIYSLGQDLRRNCRIEGGWGGGIDEGWGD